MTPQPTPQVAPQTPTAPQTAPKGFAFGVDPSTVSDPNGQQFLKAFNYFSSSPQSPASQKFMSAANSGAYDDNAKAAGIDLTKYPQIFKTANDDPMAALKENDANFGNAVKTDLGNRSTEMGNEIENGLAGKQSIGDTIVQALGTGAGFGNDLIGEGLKAAWNNAPDVIKAPIQDGVQKLLQTPQAQAGLAALKGGMDSYNAWKAKNPTIAADLEGVVNIGSFAAQFVGGGEVGKVGAEGAAAVGSKVADVAGAAADKVSEVAGNAAGAVKDAAGNVISKVAGNGGSDLEKITDAIAPKMNSAEMKAAIDEGRVTRASQGYINKALFGQAPDVVTQSDEVNQAANTILKNVPGAAKMSDAELYSSLDNSIASNAKALRPAMEATPVNIDTLGQAKDAWASLKATQVKDVGASFENMPGATKMQEDFQGVMDSLNKGSQDASGKFQPGTANNMGDVWDARIAYDKSIPSAVKKATELSSDALQYKKAMWLQNRSILNSMINDSVSGLGDTSKQGFSDMSDMYTAQQNILSKAPKPTEAGGGLIGKGGQFNLGQAAKKAAQYGGGAIVGGTILKDVL